MVEKFVRIENVGRFVKPDCSGDPKRFAKLTLIYAENGRGKSTLAEIFRSLSNNRPEGILEKRTTWTTESPYVQLMIDGQMHTFKDGAWKKAASDFLIFDSTFINDSVYAGHSIGLEHRRNLYEFLIGDEVVKLAKEIEVITTQSTEALTLVREKEGVLKATSNGVKLEDFLKIGEEFDVEAKIENSRKRIDQIKRVQEIKNASELKQIVLPELRLPSLRQLLAKNVKHISAESSEILGRHIEAHMRGDDEAAKQWLREGNKLKKGDSCPFCGQTMQGLEIAETYANIFNDQYNAFALLLGDFEKEVTGAFAGSSEALMQATITSNSAALQYWKSVLVDGEAITTSKISTSQLFGEIGSTVSGLLKRKRSNAIKELTLTDQEEAVFARHIREVEVITEYNRCVTAINLKIAEHKSGLTGDSLAAAQHELDRFEIAKKRYLPTTLTLCAEYIAAAEHRKGLEKKKEEMRAAIKPRANTILEAHQATINEFLKQFGASFEIVEAEAEIDKGKSSSSFAIKIGDKSIKLDGNPGEPCFRSALSEGDKRTLAFAVFLARLRQEPELAKKRVILDDPVMSLDGHRSQHVMEQIKELCEKTKQLIVMSHQKHFLAGVLLRNDVVDVRTLKIARRNRSESTIEVWDYDRDTENDFFRHFRQLLEFKDGIGGHSLSNVAKALRPVLEGTMKMRFPMQIKIKTMIGECLTLIQKAKADTTSPEALAGLHQFSDAQVRELTKLNEYAREFHHDQNGGKAVEEPDETGLLSYIDRTIKFAQGPF